MNSVKELKPSGHLRCTLQNSPYFFFDHGPEWSNKSSEAGV